MNITNEAVEAAAQTLYVIEHGPWISGGGLAVGGTPWGTSREARERERYLVRARAALEAAAPHLMAQAWDEGFGKGSEFEGWSGAPDNFKPDFTNPYRSQA